jgi:GTPase SAR1 family protein
VDEVNEDHRKVPVCAGYPGFQKELPSAWLERAGQRLARTDYRVAFVGPYKAGKSTFLSALFSQPGLLPAQDAECTFSVSVVTAPPPGQPEQVKVAYYTAEEALRNVLDNNAFAKLYKDRFKDRDALLAQFDETRAAAFVRQSAEAHLSDDLRREAAQVLDFLKCLGQFRDRLGRTHLDGIERLDTYVRKQDDTEIGHLLLIRLVEIQRQNVFLRENRFQIADTPGIDSLNQAARTITFNYLREADAVVYVAQARGLATEFETVRGHLSQFHNDIREKLFVIANQADWYDVKSMRRQDGKKPMIETVYENIVNPLQAIGLNAERLYFTCGRISELLEKKRASGVTPDEEVKLGELRSALDERRKALDRGINPACLARLDACFDDGGVGAFRKELVEYLQYDIEVERLREVFLDLDKAYAALKKLLDPEQAKLKDILGSLKPRSQQISDFFDQAKAKFLEKVGVMATGAPRAVGALSDKARQQTAQAVATAAERLNIDRIRTRLRVPTPLNVKVEVIQLLKADLSAKFTQAVRDSISPVFRAKLVEQAAESKVGEILRLLAKGYGSDFDQRFDALLDRFCARLDDFTLQRTREETWPIQDSEMKPAAFEVEWSAKVEEDFRADLKGIFTEQFNEAEARLHGVLARHYQGIVQDLSTDFEKLLDEVSASIKRDPDRVALPVKLLSGSAEESEDEARQRCLLSYFRLFDTVRKLRDPLAPQLEGSR